MALTKVSTDGVKDDAITAGKIPANAIGASELADNAVDSNAIADDAVTTNKIADNNVTFQQLGSNTVKTGNIEGGAVTTDRLADDAVTAAKLANNSVNSDQIINGSIDTAHIADSQITTGKVADDAITQAKINIPLSNRNIIINGAMNVAQRGTSSTSTGFQTCDRWQVTGSHSGTPLFNTQSQADVGYTTAPYDKGFRKSLKVTNGNHSSANASDNIEITYSFEGDEIATSGWDYVSSSKKITLSFWVKSSVAQTFYGYFRTFPNVDVKYSFPIVCSSTDWEFKTVSIVGESNFAQNVHNSFGNGTGRAMVLRIVPFYGTDYTDSGAINNAWQNYSSGVITPVYDTSWYLTNGATFELTGVQLEVGDVNTEFEQKSFAQELAACQRYYFRLVEGADHRPICMGSAYTSTINIGIVHFPCKMRTIPTVEAATASNYYRIISNGSTVFASNVVLEDGNSTCMGVRFTGGSGASQGTASYCRLGNASAYVAFNAEL